MNIGAEGSGVNMGQLGECWGSWVNIGAFG